MGLLPGRYKIRYLADSSQVVINMDYYDIIAESEEFIAIFKRGKSVYLPGVGSQYEPARIYFGEFVSAKESVDDNSRESWVDIRILLDCPIRSR